MLMGETAKRRNSETAKKPICHFPDLGAFQNALAVGFRVYELTKTFPDEERYALADQVRRSSRSVCANIANAWWKRRHKAAFVAKLSNAEGEAAETQVHLEFGGSLDDAYEKIIGQLVRMIDQLQKWLIKNSEHHL
jgi:four helix bundle protein